MENDKLKQYIEQVIDSKLNAMNNLTTPYHQHNGYDNSRLDPKVALLGFPIYQTATASVAPTFVPEVGTFVFQTDTTPAYYLWAYLSYQSGSTITNAWKGVALT